MKSLPPPPRPSRWAAVRAFLFGLPRRLKDYAHKRVITEGLFAADLDTRWWNRFFAAAMLVSFLVAFGLHWLLPVQSYVLLGLTFTYQKLVWYLRGLLMSLVFMVYVGRLLWIQVKKEKKDSDEPKPFFLIRSLVRGGPAGKLFGFVGYCVFILALQFGASLAEALIPMVLLDLYLLVWALVVQWGDPTAPADGSQAIGHAVGAMIQHKAFVPLIGIVTGTITFAGIVYKGHSNVVVSVNTLEGIKIKSNVDLAKINADLEAVKVRAEADVKIAEINKGSSAAPQSPPPAPPSKPVTPPKQASRWPW